ncbi:uncharacterized protein N7482_005595 [Penicillium canariense]|uniref:WW domain-containing protein n=1 Tax=Penicillium canariense TaxID=189055 RepID=A0A9W9I2M8_9EURO|nr:uncharacterized protein N7482_005595 [Penicillium canariense]KAJ5166814.1 hypothetical protein N7482_005595 [Penicillium canariense]
MYGSHIPQGSPQGHGGAPLPPGWTAQYVAEEQRYIFINQRTGERSWTHPSPPSNYGGPAPRGYPPSSAGPGGAPQNHNMLYGGVGLAAGLAGGAFMMHEHDKHKEHDMERRYAAEAQIKQHQYDDQVRRLEYENQNLRQQEAREQEVARDYREEARLEDQRRFEDARRFQEEERFEERREWDNERRFEDERRFQEEERFEERREWNDERRFEQERFEEPIIQEVVVERVEKDYVYDDRW